MGEALRNRLKQSKFENPVQEATLSLMVAASHLRAELDRSVACHGISSEQYNILRILRGVYPEGHACGAIAERMIDRAPDITRRLDALEKQGFVKRERSEEDRRVVYISITKKGLQLIEKLQPALQAMQEAMFKKFTAEECESLTRLCEKIYEGDAAASCQ